MIGIYQDNFIEYLERHVGDRVVTHTRNIVMPCPYCGEINEDKDHYHLWISTEAPIFHCFRGGCEKGGMLGKLIMTLEGHDISDKFFDKKAFDAIPKTFKDKDDEKFSIQTPTLEPDKFRLKEEYIRRRIKFANKSSRNIKGLIYDVFRFIEENPIEVTDKLNRLMPYLQDSFVGFLTEHGSTVMFRNIDSSSEFKFFKLKIVETNFQDYYRIPGGNPRATKVVLAEGIFDILSEQIYDTINIKDDVLLYASVLSSKFLSLIQSIVYYEQIFRPKIVILSDRGISLEYYKKLKKYNPHIIDTMEVYYNKTGKDFNDLPLIPTKFVV